LLEAAPGATRAGLVVVGPARAIMPVPALCTLLAARRAEAKAAFSMLTLQTALRARELRISSPLALAVPLTTARRVSAVAAKAA